ncbi:DUF302 domain-containing protein [Antarctobacter sp.]|uniref:DUF302 domain-containing protein n=1 Tax=Antarctobacter sp. TaxID=1872577 RepID=UPI002B273AE7|nr:DUF302 domain-containing protein [Antarctobacter sp.]
MRHRRDVILTARAAMADRINIASAHDVDHSSALQTGQTMALYLPLRVLFFEDAQGQTWALYDDPAGIAPSHGLAADDPDVTRMQAALERFVTIATSD